MNQAPRYIPVFASDSTWLDGLRPGDPVHRWLGPVPMLLEVTRVTSDRIICGAWEFDRKTGAEIDEELGWGPDGTGSWIRPVES
jgi:hypothetical protein